jgi:AP-3 complex subunit beta
VLATLPEDHELLLRHTLPLLRSRNSAVVLAVAALHQQIGNGDRAVLHRIGRSLVRVMRNHREVQFVVLTNIVELARTTPELFVRYLKDFFIAESEPSFVRNMKLDVLAALASTENVPIILKEFTRYVKDADKAFVRRVIQAVVRVANSLPTIADRCLRGLLALVTTDNDAVVAEAVRNISDLS